MNKRSFVRSLAAVAACFGASAIVTGCAPEEVTGETSQPILNGVATNLRPEVGQFFHRGAMCTATLVAPRYAVTASHCLNVNNFADTSLPGGSILRLTDTPVGVRDFAVDRVFGYGRVMGEMTPAGWLNTDVALVRLQTAVPSNVARPAAMQSWYPATGQYSTVFGYGCTDRGSQVGAGVKRYAMFLMGQSPNNLCSGDSGGPAFANDVTHPGPQWGVNSGFWDRWIFGSNDQYADLAFMVARIEAQIRQDNAGLEPATDRPGADYLSVVQSPANALSCRSRCESDPRCVSFTFVPAGVQGANALCFLKDALAAAVPHANAGVTSGVSRNRANNFESFYNRPGADYRNFEPATATPVLCASECARDERCRAFTYATPGMVGGRGRCYLKDSSPAPVRDSRGPVSGTRGGMELGTNRVGSNYSTFDVRPIPEACQAACARDSVCRAWTYVGPSGSVNAQCLLRNAIPAATFTNDSRIISGLRDAEFTFNR